MNRQISFLLNNFKYDAEGEDTDNEGILVPRYVAVGRQAPNGTVYKPVSKKDEFDLVPVKSIITKKSGKLNVVTPDHLSDNFRRTDIPDGSAIGLSLGTSFTESTTQSILGLKHGGHERVQDLTGNLRAPKNCTVREEGRFLILKVRGKELKYPRPEGWVSMGKEQYEEGEIIGAAYHTTSPIYKLNAVINLLGARGSKGKKYFEKDQVHNSDCYAYEEGKITYKENNGEIQVFIGEREYTWSPEALYYYPEGTVIKKYQRFCSGVVNMRQVTSDLGNDIQSTFIIFRDQYYMLSSPGFQKNHVVGGGDMQEEIVELVFAGLMKNTRDEETGDLVESDYLGLQNSILSRTSFFTTLSYGWSGRVINKAMRGELNLENDIMTETVLGLLLNNKLDNKDGKY